jgi:hypothetical protein
MRTPCHGAPSGSCLLKIRAQFSKQSVVFSIMVREPRAKYADAEWQYRAKAAEAPKACTCIKPIYMHAYIAYFGGSICFCVRYGHKHEYTRIFLHAKLMTCRHRHTSHTYTRPDSSITMHHTPCSHAHLASQCRHITCEANQLRPRFCQSTVCHLGWRTFALKCN